MTPSPSEPTPCLKCGQNRIWANTSVQMNVHSGNTGGLWGQHSCSLQALVCTRCGFTELYAVEPERLQKSS